MLDLQVGSYRIVKRLAKGGMGEVYLASHDLMDRDAVIKVLHPDLSHNKDLVTRFFNEARAAASIRHPAIVDVFDVGYADGRAYIVMEYLRGENLAARLERGRLDPEHAIAITRQLAGALRAAHERGIVHRDLKPENIFIIEDPDVPGGERVKVLDFGVAKLAQEQTPSMTARGSIFGTPAYMAPEQCMDAAAVDHRADLYALGCILYELLCGTPPFGKGGLELLAAHLRDQPEPLRMHDPTIPPDLEEITLQLLAKNPADRIQSCAELIQALGQSDSSSAMGAMGDWKSERMSRPRMAPGARRTETTDEGLAFAATVAPPDTHPGVNQTVPEVPAGLQATNPPTNLPRAGGEQLSLPPGGGTGPVAASATTYFSAGQMPEPAEANAGEPRRRGLRGLVAVIALAALAGGAALAVSMSNRGNEPPTTSGSKPVVTVETPAEVPDAAISRPAESILLDQAEKELTEERWEDAGYTARRIVDLLADRPDAPERKRAEEIQKQARAEDFNKWTYERFEEAAKKGDMRDMVNAYEQLAEDSVYRGKAEARYERARDKWLEPKRKQARALAKDQRCEQIEAIMLEVGFLFPESAREFQKIMRECQAARSPSPNTAASALTTAMLKTPPEEMGKVMEQMSNKDKLHAAKLRHGEIKRFMKEARPSMHACAEDLGIKEDVNVRFNISPEGKVQDIVLDKGTPEFHECVRRKLTWRDFPPSFKVDKVKEVIKSP